MSNKSGEFPRSPAPSKRVKLRADLSELTEAPSPVDTTLVGYDWPRGATKQVAYVDARRHVIELFVAQGDPWQWADLSELTGAPLAVGGSLAGYDWLNGNTKQVVYVDEQGQVIELWSGLGGQWHYATLLRSAERRPV